MGLYSTVQKTKGLGRQAEVHTGAEDDVGLFWC